MRILSVGQDPATIDFSNLPDGIDESYIRTGVEQAVEAMRARGWDAQICYVPPDVDGALAAFRRSLAEGPVDVVLFGGGLRMPPERLDVFEALINDVRGSAPQARLAFDNDPTEGAEAAARQVAVYSG